MKNALLAIASALSYVSDGGIDDQIKTILDTANAMPDETPADDAQTAPPQYAVLRIDDAADDAAEDDQQDLAFGEPAVGDTSDVELPPADGAPAEFGVSDVAEPAPEGLDQIASDNTAAIETLAPVDAMPETAPAEPVGTVELDPVIEPTPEPEAAPEPPVSDLAAPEPEAISETSDAPQIEGDGALDAPQADPVPEADLIAETSTDEPTGT